MSKNNDDTIKTNPHSLCFNFEVYSKNNIGSILCEQNYVENKVAHNSDISVARDAQELYSILD